jgi:protein PsiE
MNKTKEKGMSKNKNLIQVLIGLTEQALLLTIAIATIGAAVIEIMRILSVMTVNLSDLFLLFIYAEVLGMVGVFYKENRIPVTLPLIIAITALTRMIVIQTKGLDSVNIIFEASGILLLAIAAYIMSKKEELSLKKLIKKKTLEDSLGDKD